MTVTSVDLKNELELAWLRKNIPSGSAVKDLPALQETWQELRVQFLSQKDLLEKEIAAHSSILAW